MVWSLQARDDLREIGSFIAADNRAAAESFGFRLVSRVELLENFPQLGRVVPEQEDEDVRELIVRPYRIVYQVMAGKRIVAIARVWHAARGQPEIPERLEF